MVFLVSATLGAIVGALTAKRRGGNGLDIAQYATGFAIAFAIVGLFGTLAITSLD